MTRWMHFEVWIPHEDSGDERESLLNLGDTIFEFVHEGCKDLELSAPHVSSNLSCDPPEWADAAPDLDR